MTIAEPATGDVYLPVTQSHETGMTLLIRTSHDPASIAPAVTREVHALEKNLPAATQ
jgi:putative ABC transport system permease protein